MHTDNNYIVLNVMKESVELLLDFDIEELGICGCKRCRADIMAHILNNIPPKYVVTPEDEVFSRISAYSRQGKAALLIAIHEAAKAVRANPQHSDDTEEQPAYIVAYHA